MPCSFVEFMMLKQPFPPETGCTVAPDRPEIFHAGIELERSDAAAFGQLTDEPVENRPPPTLSPKNRVRR